jgi:uncharacterized membrane protein
MASLQTLTAEVADAAWSNVVWMAWNTLLAMLPVLLAVVLFRYEGRRGVAWWVGLAAFILLLPNAPYIVTDLIHLRGDVLRASGGTGAFLALLLTYGAFVAFGLCLYAAALAEVGGALRRAGHDAIAGRVELGLHALCAVGVVLGRIARLNSWDTITAPVGTLERALATLSWDGTPVAVVVLFVVIWLGHATTRVLLHAAAAWFAGLRGAAPS